MDFGKPDDPAAVDWALPDDGATTALALGGTPVAAPRAWIGSTAWGDRGFLGPVYPRDTRAADFLAAYGRQFNAVELNATFYRSPDVRQVRKWAHTVPADFRFCPKVPKSVSQRGDLGAGQFSLLDFAKAVQHFEHKLGPCFLQLPQGFGSDRSAVLEEFLERWPPTLPLAVEFRHPIWFSPEGRGLDGFAALHARGYGAVITDVGARRDAAHMHLTAPWAFVRFVGNDHPSDRARLASWVERAAGWFAAGLEDLYFMVHQPEPVASARDAGRFAEALNARGIPGLTARGPRLLTGGGGASAGASSDYATLFSPLG